MKNENDINKNEKLPERVNEQIVRGVASMVCILSIITILIVFLQPENILSAVIACLLFIDFSIRAFADSRFSVFALFSKMLNSRLFRFRQSMTLLRPKKFAAGIGAVLSFSALIMWTGDLYFIMQLLMGMLAVFSFLEAAFRFCAGCKIFSLLIRTGFIKDDYCEDCAVE